jgi:hypothetical protein
MLKRLASELLIQFRKSEKLERKIKENLTGSGYEL